MSEPSDPTGPPTDGRSPGRRHAAMRSHGRVFVVGGLAMAASVLMAAGLTWAGPEQAAPSGLPAATPSAGLLAATAPVTTGAVPTGSATIRPAAPRTAADTPAGSCVLIVDGVPRIVEVDRARTATMIAAVGQQVRAPDSQAARALDVALADRSWYLPKVTDALGLLARDDDTAPTAAGLAEIRALHLPGALHCASPVTDADADRDRKLDNGLRPHAEDLRVNAGDAFGELTVRGYGKTADARDPASLDGRAMSVRFTPVDEANRARGWVFAHWLVARAKTYVVETVSYADWTWRARTGWVPARAGRARPDAVYVAVVKGTP